MQQLNLCKLTIEITPLPGFAHVGIRHSAAWNPVWPDPATHACLPFDFGGKKLLPLHSPPANLYISVAMELPPDLPCRLPGSPLPVGVQEAHGEEEGNSSSSHLPMEMLIKVFAQLDARTLMLSVPAVCRWWREVYYSSATALDYSWAPAGLVTVRHD